MTRLTFFRLPALLLGLAFFLSACDASLDAEPAELTTAEAEEAAEIVAEALAEDGAGFLATTRDLTASVSSDGLVDGPRSIRGHFDGRPHPHVRCRGGEFDLNYDEQTGTHLVSYTCSIEGNTFAQSYDALLSYQYRDAEGGFVPNPVQDWSSVDSVAFGGMREGSFEVTRGSFSGASTFEQQGQWSLAGLNDDASPARLAGSQTRSGTRVRTGPNASVERAFSVALSGDDIDIVPNADGPGFIATGELVYSLEMEVVRDGQTRTQTVEGTIELETNGRALLRIIGIRGVYRVALGSGAVTLGV